jgi:hypothetical protein
MAIELPLPGVCGTCCLSLYRMFFKTKFFFSLVYTVLFWEFADAVVDDTWNRLISRCFLFIFLSFAFDFLVDFFSRGFVK